MMTFPKVIPIATKRRVATMAKRNTMMMTNLSTTALQSLQLINLPLLESLLLLTSIWSVHLQHSSRSFTHWSQGDGVYYTTGCKRGKSYAVVTISAKHSFVGRTASLVEEAKDQGHFKAIMNSIGYSLLVLVVFWILAAWIGGFFRHLKIATPEASSENLLHYALILLIIGVPVGLPVVTTTTLAVGAAYLAKQKAIVQKLTAIESLAVRSTTYAHLTLANKYRVSIFFALTRQEL